MNIFKKKEYTEEELNELTGFSKLWHTPRTHAMIVLGAYFIFFAVIIILFGSTKSNVNINDNKQNNKDNKIDASYLLKNIDESKIEYIDTYNSKNNGIYILVGKYEGENFVGNLTHGSETFEISIDKDLNCTATNKKYQCPENIEYGYFMHNYILNLISDNKATNYKDLKKYTYSLNDGLDIDLTYNDDTIQKINTRYNDDLYEITFNYIKE